MRGSAQHISMSNMRTQPLQIKTHKSDKMRNKSGEVEKHCDAMRTYVSSPIAIRRLGALIAIALAPLSHCHKTLKCAENVAAS